MPRPSGARKRARGGIDRLRSGALRVRVYTGKDPITKRRHYISEVIPPGPRAATLAEKARTRLLNQVDERRNPRTSATVSQLLERHLSMLDVGPSTLKGYQTYVRRHVEPFIGTVKAGELDGDVLDSLYAELRRCQEHCDGKPSVDHRTRGPHQCDEHEGSACSPPDPSCRACSRRCRSHMCRPLADSTLRQIHYLLSGAYKRALRWRWVAVNPISQAEPPPPPRPEPRPPSADEAAWLVNEAWRDPDWGALVWLAMTTGARRGELCALRWDAVDLDNEVLVLRASVAKDDKGRWYLKDTKTHQQRRVSVDAGTVAVLQSHRARVEERASLLGIELAPDAFVFSLSPDQSTHLQPGSLTQRYSKMASRLGIDTHLRALRHYNATELIAAGVDVRTVGGRLGHSGGGTTTLRVYSAWREEADQRAAANLAVRMPTRPSATAVRIVEINPTRPHEQIAVALRAEILSGALRPGWPVPTLIQLAARFGVSTATAHKAVSMLNEWGLVDVASGRRTLVRKLLLPPVAYGASGPAEGLDSPGVENAGVLAPGMLDLEIRRLGKPISMVSTEVDPTDASALRQLLLDAVRRSGGHVADVGDYEMVVRRSRDSEVISTFVTAAT
ncbi:tyrosine-type recombinase/integrase [Actinopolymorpha sp. B9G3]|uniref:tyrosine-type recombinase/integrase n=1 Tax=Actinopolymorpha sp. B9G3 TaxID=3158970 RepID=UPI0032D96B6A